MNQLFAVGHWPVIVQVQRLAVLATLTFHGVHAIAQELLIPLHEGWTFQQVGKEQWYAAEVPGVVHNDLLRNGLIPDPMRNNNVDSVQWIENEDWIYRCAINANDSLIKHEHIDLVFKGLDTFVEIYFNDSLLGTTNNMFRSWGWPIRDLLKPGNNELKVIFRSAIKEGADLLQAYGIQLPADNDAGKVKVSPYVRKAAFQFGWDFAPRLVTCGIWQPVQLRLGSTDRNRTNPDPVPEHVILEQARDRIGTSFVFKVDGQPVFMKGCNLVPPASALSSVNEKDWVRLVRDMQRAGMNMVRVWAGGVYPPEAFFIACDTAGILVWQDFMFANMVPDQIGFKLSSLLEADEQVQAVHRHSSLALWCGNNELDVAWKNWGWQSTYGLDARAQETIQSTYAGLFEHDLLGSVRRSSRASYTPTSPLSNWGNAAGLRKGDLHYWGVWHGDSAFSSFANNVGRFVSEYGFQSYPDSVTLAHYIDPEYLYLDSPVLAKRQKSYKTDKPIWTAIERELGEKPTTLGRFIDCSQAVQAEAYRLAIWAHRTNQPHCMGTLYWQLNDVWAAPSWSTVDVDGRWKAAHYEVKRSYAERVLAFVRRTDGSMTLEIWSDTELSRDTVTLEFWSVQGELLRTEVKHPAGKGLVRLAEWPDGQWPAGIVVYVFGAGAQPRMFVPHAEPALGHGSVQPTMTKVEGTVDRWEVSSPVPLRAVKIEAGPGAQPSDNWFPLVPGHPVQLVIERGDRSSGQPPQASTFRR